MNSLYTALVTAGTTLLLVGCGGGSSSGGDNDSGGDQDSSFDLPQGGDTRDIEGSGTFSLSGQVSLPINIVLDADINDSRLTSAGSNDDPNNPQPLSGTTLVHGFASAEGSNGRLNSEGHNERFVGSADSDDYYRVTLSAGQRIELHITSQQNDGRYQGDLDLCVFPIDSSNIESGCRTGTAEFERISVEQSGDYLVNVHAFEGLSNYILRILPPVTGSSSASRLALSQKNPIAISLDHKLPFLLGEAIVEYTTSTIGPERVALDAIDMTSGDPLRLLDPIAYQHKVTLQQIKKLRKQPNVLYASPNHHVYALQTPNDYNSSLQYHYGLINLPSAWDLETGQSSNSNDDPIVAVIDTGVYLAHEDLRDNLIAGYDFVSNPAQSLDGDGIDDNPDDPGDNVLSALSWHGSHVSGTVSAVGDNNVGVTGVSWGTKIMPLRSLGAAGAGNSFDTIQAMRWAGQLPNDSNTIPERRADIINLSLGSSGSSDAGRAVAAALRNQGVLVIAAAGNDGSDDPSFPAAYDFVISVSAIGRNKDQITSYSNFGPTIDVAAPGGEGGAGVHSTVADGRLTLFVDTRSSDYGTKSGTSMASPHVAGVAALMKSRNKNLTPQNFEDLLVSGRITEDRGAPGRDDDFGYGLIDARKAIEAAGGPAIQPLPRLTADPIQLFAAADRDGGGFAVNNSSTANNPALTVGETPSWLTVTQSEGFRGNTAKFDFAVDRQSLAPGIYDTVVRIRPSSGAELAIPLTLEVSETEQGGELAPAYVVLLDAETRDVMATTEADVDGNYQFDQLPAGNYFVVAGSDVDVDEVMCQAGESCGVFPQRGSEEPISITENRTDVNIPMLISSGSYGAGVKAR